MNFHPGSNSSQEGYPMAQANSHNSTRPRFRDVMLYKIEPAPLALTLAFCVWTVLIHLGIWCAS